MKKILLFVLMLLVGISFCSFAFADEARTIPHKFKAYDSSTAVTQGKVIYRITGVATGSNAVFGVYNVGAINETSASNIAVEGGEATSGDAIPHMYFGEDGLVLDSGSTVIVSGCTIVIEYI